MKFKGGFSMPTFKECWIQQMREALKASPDIKDMSDEELVYALDQIYDENIKAPSINLVNNYKGVSFKLPLDNVFDIIVRKDCILAGDGVLFMQHDKCLSDMVPVIIKYQLDRKKEKKLMFQYDDGTDEFMFHDRNQRNKKVVINALYGLFGYSKFRFFNINIAQSVTASGQLIISTATCCFENFLADNTKFILFEEAILFINRIKKEYELCEHKELFANIPEGTIKDVILRIAEHTYEECIYEEDQAMYLVSCLGALSQDELKLVYYKNNIKAFHNVPYIHNLIQNIYDSIEQLRLGSLEAFNEDCKYKAIAAPEAKSLVELLILYYDIFVLDTHQIFDRVRRTKYTPKKAVMYIDTDSNFIALEEFVEYFMNAINDKYNDTEAFIFKCTSILTMVISHVIEATYREFANTMNISPEYGKRIRMKNEFLFSMLVFGTAKKRYFGKMIIQEGKLIKDGEGKIEIKGFDFKKASTKKEIYDKICKMLFNTILDVNHISYGDILRAANNYKDNIRTDVMNGSNLYYRQLSVSTPDKYKNPYSMQGIIAVLFWNAIVDKADKMEFPVEVDIIPVSLNSSMSKANFDKLMANPGEFFSNIHNVSTFRNVYNFYRDYPTEFSRMVATMQSHPDIWVKFPTSIAKPRAMVDLPDWLKSIIDVETIIHKNVNLINPILEAVGIPIINEKLGNMYSTLVSL